MGHFTLNAMSSKAETRDIELKIKHVSGYISTYAELVSISTFMYYYVLDNQWKALHQENLQFVIDNLREIISCSISKNKCNKKYYQHIIYF